MKSLWPVLILMSIATFIGCSSSKKLSGGVPDFKVEMQLEDKSGRFTVKRSTALSKNKKHLATQYKVLSGDGKKIKVLEQSITMATPGFLKNKFPVLRPFQSQYKVWFDGKLYKTETKVDLKTKSLMVLMDSPEQQWKGRRNFIFPGGNGIFCYFSQLVECLKFTGFIDKAKKDKSGKLNLTVIWDGYPYIQEQYLNISNEPFAQATIEYDGSTKEGDARFSLDVSGSVIFYLFNDSYEYAKIFWPAQGFSLFHK